MLIDTGSDISILKITNFDKVNCNEISNLYGIEDKPIETLGSASVSFTPLNSVKTFNQKFHFVSSDFSIPFDGILGLDFVYKFKVNIDLPNSEIDITISNERVKLPLFDSNFLKQDDSINTKITQTTGNNDNSETVENKNNNSNQKPTKNFSILTIKKSITIAPRSETILNLDTILKEDFVCKSSELSAGVFVANSISKPINNKAYISVINSNINAVELKNLKIDIEPLSSFQILSIEQVVPNRLANLEKLLQLCCLNKEENHSIREMCHEFNDIFFIPGDRLSYTDAVEHYIPLKENAPVVNVRPYRLPFHQRTEITNQVSKMIEDGIVKPSESQYNSPLLLVPKKPDSSGVRRWRVVVDFRRLNDITRDVTFPLPHIHDILDQLGQMKYFSTLDLASGYHQVQIAESDREKTAFSTEQGHFEFERMPFGLKTAPATFQRLMNTILVGLTGMKCFVYLDDIVVYGKSLFEHNRNLRDIFNRIKKFGLKLNPSKCKFLSKDVVYLGHRITPEGILPDTSKTEAVINFPLPTCTKDFKSFLGLCGYYRRFIPNFAEHAHPLNDLLKKDVPFLWSPFCDKAFAFFKDKLCSSPIFN